ncbi:MAG: sigma-70 family RNA polymerase sigma factor [Bryobacterales bacterium]|nr:sigma-70 family RNA polymerase sigma factor [Bryobacterales bacterium]
MHPSHDWQTLLARIAAGDSDALARFYDESSPFAYSLALRILKSPEDAEEVALDAYLQIWRTAATFNATRGSVRSWLVAIVYSRSIDRIRQRSTRPLLEHASDELMAVKAANVANPEQLAVRKQKHVQIYQVLAALPQRIREAVEMTLLEEMTHVEIAQRLNEPLGTVKTRIRRGMQLLREGLSSLGDPNMLPSAV